MRGGLWGVMRLMTRCFPLRHQHKKKQVENGNDSRPPQPSNSEKNAELEIAESGVKAILNSPVTQEVEDFRRHSKIIIFTYNELRMATKNFRSDQIIGEGGFGIVYKGLIDENVGQRYVNTQIAVKELDLEGLQGDREWLAEVNYLGQFSHPNLVKLIGYCCEDEHRLLVYEYMASGSLDTHIFERLHPPMPWSTRMKIALDAAKGLAFLHGAERPIIYRDFKTSNILLDLHYNAKLSDFGLAKEGPMGDQTHVSTRVVGTHGYAAPEYLMTGHLTAKSDVYAFGVVLLELIIGGKAMDSNRPGRQENLAEWARPLLIRGNKLPKIIDPRMEGQYSLTTAQKVAALAYQCLSQNPKERPTMSEVVEVLRVVQNSCPTDDCRSIPGHSSASNLLEEPKETADMPAGGKQHPVKNGGEGESMGMRRNEAEDGRGRS